MKKEKPTKKQKAQNLSLRSLLIAYAMVALVFVLALPKIQLSNEIYYTSREISTLREQLNVLKEENRALKNKLEQIRYKNQIIDNMN